jgi:succinate dehydrogenase / fumarate reductase cytochrome b subunit
MGQKSGFMRSSLGKKVVMGVTGLFLISFLVVHCFINSLIFFNDGGLTFNTGAHFMGHNWLIRSMELVLFLGLILHIVQAYILTKENKKARPVAYEKIDGAANSKWYSRSMGLLGTLLLIFLIIHLAHFWVVSRFTGVENKLATINLNGITLSNTDSNGHENMFGVMQITFQYFGGVLLYVFSMISLSYHLLHGFQSAFQTLGLNHKTYTTIIKKTGFWFSIIIPFIFAMMPISIYFGLIR